MLCENCGKPINSPLTGRLDPSARWGDWCDECVKDDLSFATTQAEWREMDLLDSKLRERPGHVRR